MAKRRGRGEGSINQQPDGRWLARVDLGWQNGRRRRKSFYGRTRKEAADRLLKGLRAHQQGEVLPDERQTVEQFLTRWLTQKQAKLRPRAWASYEQAVRLHLQPGIGKVALARLTPAQLETWFAEHQAAGASTRAIRYARTVLRAALNQAKRWNMVGTNAAALIDPPRHQPKEIQPLTPEQARVLLTASSEHRLGALVSVGIAMGLRLGEALGLRWQDVDVERATLRVQQALERSGGDAAARRPLIAERSTLRKALTAAPKRSEERRAIRRQLAELRLKWRPVATSLSLVEPKTKKSRRSIRMPAVVVAALKAHRARQREERMRAGAGWEESGLVFVTEIGTALDARNVTREFHALLQAAKLPRVRFHDLRHTAATLLLAQGVDPRTIMETLGHSQISLTLNTYAHVLPALQEEAANRIDAILTR
jgi:integrase